MLIRITRNLIIRGTKRRSLTSIRAKRSFRSFRSLINRIYININRNTTKKFRHIKCIIRNINAPTSFNLIFKFKTTPNVSLLPTLKSINISKIINRNTGRNEINNRTSDTIRNILSYLNISNSISIRSSLSSKSIRLTIFIRKSNLTKRRNTNERSDTLLRRLNTRSEHI